MRYLDLDSPLPALRPQHPPRNTKRWIKFGILTALVGGLIYGSYVFFWPLLGNLGQIFQAPQAVLSFIKPPEDTLRSTNGRTNILLLGVDYRKDMPSENLTDTMMLISIDLQSKKKDVVMVSVPRDLWVKLPQWKYSGGTFYSQWGKINSANAYGDAYNFPDGKGLGLAQKEMEEVLGVPIHYVVRINFYGFKQVVDSVGGVNVTVDTSFTDCEYPLDGQEDNPVFSNRYQCITFKKGSQFMNGDKALQFARSRHGTNGEGSDLARAKRQQKLILAVRQKALSVQTLSDPLKVKNLFDSLGSNVQTKDVDLGQIGAFYKLTQSVDVNSAQNIVLTNDPNSDANLLVLGNPALYGGSSVFVPIAGDGDYSDIQSYIHRKLDEASSGVSTSSAQPSGQ